ncbi:DUF6470 family protein [Halalkalibacter krulwichiae]|uniref:Uncharacterized protein n=1 Tax=Halalkalibacter krulwichiae TaxID=199441 RepID=A0A1X9MFA3_9BACI|nr:DUF6470 family protein [Halalkalibacter krulwichiae]ARK32096.1 hypothetical protein BkAM31D_20880 [Halalkalibacter krulwichiae]
MQLLAIHIEQTAARIGLRSHRAEMKINQPAAEMSIQQTHHILKMNTTEAKMQIDQTEAFADANLKSVLRYSREQAASAVQIAQSYIAKTAQQGDQLMRIENGTGIIARQAKWNAERPPKQATIGYMPKSADRVRFDFQPSQLSITANERKPNITINRRDVQIDIPKWQTEAYLQQKNHISFQSVGSIVNKGL